MKQLKDSHFENEAIHRLIIDNAAQLIVLIQDGLTQFVNNKVEEMTGYSKTELLGQPFLFIVHPEDQLHVIEIFQKNTSSQIEFRLIRKDGKVIWVETNGVLLRWQGKLATLSLISYITERKNLEKELENSLHRVLQIQEEERKALANELHDETSQYLALLKMQLSNLLFSRTIQDPKVFEKVQYLEYDAGRAIERIQWFSHQLRPIVLDDIGLCAAMEQLIDDCGRLTGVAVRLIVEGSEPVLSEDIRLAVFRIAQEALNNSLKYAEATQVTLFLLFKENELEMAVLDNGIGFDVRNIAVPPSTEGTFGLITMRERAKLINATLDIDSQTEHGTTVKLIVVLIS